MPDFTELVVCSAIVYVAIIVAVVSYIIYIF